MALRYFKYFVAVAKERHEQVIVTNGAKIRNVPGNRTSQTSLSFAPFAIVIDDAAGSPANASRTQGLRSIIAKNYYSAALIYWRPCHPSTRMSADESTTNLEKKNLCQRSLFFHLNCRSRSNVSAIEKCPYGGSPAVSLPNHGQASCLRSSFNRSIGHSGET
jgi:hypothetical protein